MKKFDKDRLILGFAGPVLALVVALALTTVVLLASGRNPLSRTGSCSSRPATSTYRS